MDILMDIVSMMKNNHGQTHGQSVHDEKQPWTNAWTKCLCLKNRKQYVTKQLRFKISH